LHCHFANLVFISNPFWYPDFIDLLPAKPATSTMQHYPTKTLHHTARTLFRLLAASIPLAVSLSHAQSNLVMLISAAGEHIGAGQTYYTTNQTNIVLSGTPTAVTVQAFGFTMIFAGPGQSPLTAGVYSNAVQYPSNGAAPGLSAFGNGRACTNVCGNFQILELATNASGQVVKLWATFLQHCECDTTPPLTGEIRYKSQVASGGPRSRTLLVPADFPTIQSALNDVNLLAVDTVLVSPGLYQESVQFGSNSAHLVSVAGPSATFIMAPGTSAVGFGVDYKIGAFDALLYGFTLTNSTTGVHVAGGFSPTIISNVIVNCDTGIDCNTLGIGRPASPIIRNNIVSGCSGYAVQFWWTEGPLLEGNRLEGNGAGIYLWAAGTPEIRNNIISSNRGDGVSMANQYGVNIIQNLIMGNTGIGLHLGKPQGGPRGPWAINNTVVDNGGAGISTDGFCIDAEVVNNIVVGNLPLQLGQGIFQFNNFYPSPGTSLSGPVTNLIGSEGNISANPYLVCQPEQDYHLLPDSPCIDAGTNGAHVVLASDFDGHPRILAGSTNSSPRLDMGAFEFAQGNPTACLFVYCPTNIVVIAAPGESSALVTYPPAYATPGASISYSPPSGSTFPAGDDPVTFTAVYGTNILNCGFTISVLTTTDFVRALNETNLTWSAAGDAPWFAQNAVTHDGLAAAQSGPITDNQSSTLQTVVSGPATLNFWWRVWSETNHDFLSVSANGTETAAISGAVDWRQQTVYLGFGSQTVRWTYSKDTNGSAGQDAAWLDLVSSIPGPTPPTLTSQPASLDVAPGQTAVFSASAFGTPPLAFQWTFNGTNIPSATDSSFTVTNVRSSDVGMYALIVTNPVGTTNTSAAVLNLAQVLAWGANSGGQTNVPLGLTNLLAISGGYQHSGALRADGTMVAWGANNAGQTNVPSTLSNAVAISSRGGDFCMALRPDGTVVAWGSNSYQQTNVPSGLSNVVAIAAGGDHCLILKADGTVLAWGYIHTVPAGLSNVVAIAAGDIGDLFLKSDGTLVNWAQQPAVPPGISNVVAIAAGYKHSLVIKQDGSVVAWGNNSYGQTNVPAGLSNVVAIGAGDWHCCALKADGTVVTWGSYYTANGYIPAAPIPGLSNIVAIAAGSDHDVALLGQGPPVLQAAAMNPRRLGNAFALSLPTQSGRTYRLEFRDSLNQSNWSPLPLVAGNGTTKTLVDTNPPANQRFYRVRRW
jgi:parallel beta-helix repeat protein